MHGGFSKATVVRVGLLVAKVTLASWGWRFTPAGGSEDGSWPPTELPTPTGNHLHAHTRRSAASEQLLAPGTGFPSPHRPSQGLVSDVGRAPVPLPLPSHPEQKPGSLAELLSSRSPQQTAGCQEPHGLSHASHGSKSTLFTRTLGISRPPPSALWPAKLTATPSHWAPWGISAALQHGPPSLEGQWGPEALGLASWVPSLTCMHTPWPQAPATPMDNGREVPSVDRPCHPLLPSCSFAWNVPPLPIKASPWT